MSLVFGSCLGSLVAVAQAETSIRYCYKYVPPQSACFDTTARHSYNNNVASGSSTYNGNQYLRKCETMKAWDNASAVYSRNCYTGYQVTGRWNDYQGASAGGGGNPGALLVCTVGNDDATDTQNMVGVAKF